MKSWMVTSGGAGGFSCAGIFEQSMGAKNLVGIVLSYLAARLHRLAELISWNQFLGSFKVLKFGLRRLETLHEKFKKKFPAFLMRTNQNFLGLFKNLDSISRLSLSCTKCAKVCADCMFSSLSFNVQRSIFTYSQCMCTNMCKNIF